MNKHAPKAIVHTTVHKYSSIWHQHHDGEAARDPAGPVGWVFRLSSLVRVPIVLPDTAPIANLGLLLCSADMKKIASGAIHKHTLPIGIHNPQLRIAVLARGVPVLSHAITSPPMIDASYFLPSISPPSPTHHDANTNNTKLPAATRYTHRSSSVISATK